jgi:cytochrome P450
MFGSSIDAHTTEHLTGRLLDAMRTLNLKLFLYFLPRQIPLPGDRAFKRAVVAIDDALLRLVGERRKSPSAQQDLLSLLIAARDEQSNARMDDRQLRDELVTLFVAGNDTTANALTWFWYVLDRHPEVDRRVRQELTDVLGDRAPTAEDLPKLSYLKNAIQETMRLYPPVWMFPRFCDREQVVGGYTIPAGTPILLAPYVTHRDPAAWERAETFDPDRFTAERSAGRPRYAYFPFGGGARQCIGNAFAIMEAQILAATLAQRFRPRVVPGAKVVPSSASTLKPKHGLPVVLERA